MVTPPSICILHLVLAHLRRSCPMFLMDKVYQGRKVCVCACVCLCVHVCVCVVSVCVYVVTCERVVFVGQYTSMWRVS